MTEDSPDSVPEKRVTLELSSRERDLLLKYGYPFPNEAQRLKDSRAIKGLHHVAIGPYWIEMMIADIVRSAKKIRSRALLDELDALCDVLENTLSQPSRVHLVALK
jgi:hypothetical protein